MVKYLCSKTNNKTSRKPTWRMTQTLVACHPWSATWIPIQSTTLLTRHLY